LPRTRSDALTEREAQIMGVLWELGRATAEQVRAALPGSPHDSTVRTLLRVLESKGYATHAIEGKAYVYRPLVDRDKAQQTAVRSLLTRLFGGSAEALVLRLIEDERITAAQLEQIRKKQSLSQTPRPARRDSRGDQR
jgi:predicted transcriptional regulator